MKPLGQILVIKLVLAFVTSGGFRHPLIANAFKTWAFGLLFRRRGMSDEAPGANLARPDSCSLVFAQEVSSFLMFNKLEFCFVVRFKRNKMRWAERETPKN
jgi:hypothetical protein